MKIIKSKRELFFLLLFFTILMGSNIVFSSDDTIDDYPNPLEIKLDHKVQGKGNFSQDDDVFMFIPSVDGAYFIDDYTSNGVIDEYFNVRISVNSEDFLPVESFYSNNKWLFIFEKGKKYFLHTQYNNKNDEYSFSLKGPVDDDFGNTKEKAKEIGFNKKIEINRNYYGDVDCLTFTPSVTGLYHISNLTDPDNTYSNLIYELSIYDSNGNFIDKIRNEGKGYFNLDKDKKYFMYTDVRATEPGKSDKLVFSVDGPEIDDFSDTKENAALLLPNNLVNGIADFFYDCDYFVFKPQEDGVYCLDNIVLKGDSLQDLDRYLKISDQDDKNVGFEESYNKNKAFFNLKKGLTYYFSLKNNTNYNRTYYSFEIKGPIKDDYANSKEKAYEVFLDSKISGECNYVNDYDYFKFTPSESGLFYIDDFYADQLSKLNDTLNTNNFVRLYDSNNNKIDIFTRSDYTQKGYFRLVKGNTYYFLITEVFFNDLEKYSFILRKAAEDDFGDTPSFSKEFKIGESISGCLEYFEDVDMFNFTTNSEGIYNVSILDIKGGYIRVFDKYNKQLEKYTNRNENLEWYYLKANETYYVLAGSYNDAGSYNVKVEGPTIDDYGNIFEDGVILKVDNPIMGAINYLGDKDIFKIAASKKGIVYFKIQANFNIQTKLYNMDNRVLDFIDYGNNIIGAEIGDYGVYYLEISNKFTKPTGKYIVTISDKLDDLQTHEYYRLNGYIKPDFYDISTKGLCRAGFIVRIVGTTLFAVTDENGYFEIPNVQKSDVGYEVEIIKDSYLKRTIVYEEFNSDKSISKQEAHIEMWAGDASDPQDGVINMADILCLAKVFNTIKGDAEYNEKFDINRDSMINMLDIVLCAKHFNQQTDDYLESSK